MKRVDFMSKFNPKGMILAFLGVLYLVLVLLSCLQYNHIKHRIHEEHCQLLTAHIRSVLSCCEVRARLVFEEVLNQPEVLELVRRGWVAADDDERAQARDELFRLTSPTFANLQKYSFRQMHFHFPDCSSFLRLHFPEKFGDSLVGVRATVEAANRDHRFVSGFEEGRIFNGYRFVFPLEQDGAHLGSVETSVSPAMVGRALQENFGRRFQFLMSRQVVVAKVFPDGMGNYRPSSLDPEFLIDVAASEMDAFSAYPELVEGAKARRAIAAGLASGNNFHREVWVGGKLIQAHFMAVPNFQGRVVAYLVAVEEVPALARFKLRLVANLVILTTLFLVAAVLMYLLLRTQAQVSQFRKLLPICSACKKIRREGADSWDPEAWISIESYLDAEDGHRLTHGLCPECYARYIPDGLEKPT